MINSVSLLAFDHMLSSSVAIPLEMLEATRARLQVKRDPRANFVVRVVAKEIEPLHMLGGFQVRPSHCFAELEQVDLIVVPALWRNPKPLLREQQQAISWLAKQYHQGASIIAIGTGVCLLAEAGILDNKPATTHWHYLEQFAKDYPRVQLQPEFLLTQAGRIYCAASVNSGADLMVHFIGLHYGRELALKVEQQFSPEVRSGFESKVFYADQNHQHPDEDIALVQTWLQQNSQKSVKLERLAAMLGVSTRQFNRRFKAVVGLTPMQYLQQLRCLQAKELLQNSNLRIDDIAELVGYGDASYFSRVYRQYSGQTPSEFRHKVRAKLFISEVDLNHEQH